MEMKNIYSTDAAGQNQLSPRKSTKIGEIRDDVLVMEMKGHMMPCTLLIWDFYDDGKKDYFYFSLENKLIHVSINESRNDSIIRLYTFLVKLGAGLDEMVNSVRNR